jgi:hypothetical protein
MGILGPEVDNSDLMLPPKKRRPGWEARLKEHLRIEQAKDALNPQIRLVDKETGWRKTVRQNDAAKAIEEHADERERAERPMQAAFRKVNKGLKLTADIGTMLIPGAGAAKTAYALAGPGDPSKQYQFQGGAVDVPAGHCINCGQKKPKRKRAPPAADSKTARRAALVKRLCAEGMSVPEASHKIKAEGLEY